MSLAHICSFLAALLSGAIMAERATPHGVRLWSAIAFVLFLGLFLALTAFGRAKSRPKHG